MGSFLYIKLRLINLRVSDGEIGQTLVDETCLEAFLEA